MKMCENKLLISSIKINNLISRSLCGVRDLLQSPRLSVCPSRSRSWQLRWLLRRAVSPAPGRGWRCIKIVLQHGRVGVRVGNTTILLLQRGVLQTTIEKVQMTGWTPLQYKKHGFDCNRYAFV